MTQPLRWWNLGVVSRTIVRYNFSMNTAEATRILLSDPTMTPSLAAEMVATWERNGMRNRKGEPITQAYLARIVRPSRGMLKSSRPVATRMTSDRMDAHRRYRTGIE